MSGISILLSSLGIDPKEVQKAVETIAKDLHTSSAEIRRQGIILEAIATKVGIDVNEIVKEKENDGRKQLSSFAE